MLAHRRTALAALIVGIGSLGVGIGAVGSAPASADASARSSDVASPKLVVVKAPAGDREYEIVEVQYV